MALPTFEQLVDQHQSMVYSIAVRMTGDRGLAEEIAQDVFLEMDRHMERFSEAEHLCFWLRRVALSRSTDALRRRRVRGMDRWVEMEEGHGVSAPMETAEFSAQVESMLNSLSESQRAVVILRYQEDLTPQEIATTMSAPVATIKSQLQRALKQLRSLAGRQEICRGV